MSPRGDWRNGPATVYRAFDADDALLYVGVSGMALQRFQQHAATKGWWREVTSVTLTHYERRFEALLAEEEAIGAERPKYNGLFREELERRALERAEFSKPSAVLAREQERKRREEANRPRTHYHVPGLFCTNCGWSGQWVPKGKRIDESECPACGLRELAAPEQRPRDDKDRAPVGQLTLVEKAA